MASLNDTINAITGRLLANPLAPAVEASERSRNERDKLASENRLTKRATDLEERRAKLEEEKATSILKLRNEFDEKQGKLNREGRLEEIKAQAGAYIDRLTTVERQRELARLRSRLGVPLKGSTTEDQIEDGLTREASGDYPAAIGAHKTLEDQQGKIADLRKSLDAALKGDQEFVEKTTNEFAAAKAQKVLRESLTAKEKELLGERPSISTIGNNVQILKARREQLEDIYNSALTEAKPEASLLVLSREFKRPLADLAIKLQGDYQTEQNNLMKFEMSDGGKMAQNRAMILRGLKPAVGPLAGPEKMPAGEGAYDRAAKMAKAATAAGAPPEFRAAMGERQAVEQEAALAEAGQATNAPNAPPVQSAAQGSSSVVSPMEARNQVSSGANFGTAQDPGLSIMQRALRGYGYQDPGAPQLLPDFSMPTMEGIRTGIDSAFAPIRDAGNAIGNALNPSRSVNPAIDAKAAAIWGPDAVPLLKEAEKLATSRGMDPGEQQAVFNAAISGDTNAQGKVKLMLDYVRQAKQADQTGAFQPVMPMREYPGTINTAPVYQGPQLLPAR